MKWETDLPLFERAGEPLWGETLAAPKVLVIDDGKMDDVVEILEDLGAEPRRRSPGEVVSGSGWAPPERLLVVAAEAALTLHLPLRQMPPGAVAIAVSDGRSRTLCSAMHRLGCRYVVRRPFHPLALRMLLRQALCPDAGKRGAPRAAFGAEVSWRIGWRRRRGAIIDVSSRGCLLLAREGAELGSRLKIRFPAQVADGRALVLAGRVMRRAAVAGGRFVLGVEFERPSGDVEERMRRLLAALGSGPPRLSREPFAATAVNERGRGGQSASRSERRREPRAALHREIVALDLQAEEVRYTLVGRDLSMGGIRVEAHPSLALGEPLDLALYDTVDSEPLTLHAVVARDDGPRGCWLRFTALEREARERVARAIRALPSLECVEGPEPASAWVLAGQVEPKPGG